MKDPWNGNIVVEELNHENIEARMKELFTLVGKKRWWNNVL